MTRLSCNFLKVSLVLSYSIFSIYDQCYASGAKVISVSGRANLTINTDVTPGQTFYTGKQSRARLVFEDKTIVDLGPQCALRFTENQTGIEATISHGRYRIVRSHNPGKPFSIKTFLFKAHIESGDHYFETKPSGETDYQLTAGNVRFEHFKKSKNGKYYPASYTLNEPQRYVFKTEPLEESTQDFAAGTPIIVDEQWYALQQTAITKAAPKVASLQSPLLKYPEIDQMLGTGVLKQAELSFNDVTGYFQQSDAELINSFDVRHSAINRSIASKSGNFRIPSSITRDFFNVERLRSSTGYAGAPPTPFLPGSFSRVRINLEGL